LENYDYLSDLTKDPNSGLYDLFITTYNGMRVPLSFFTCGRMHEMRMDLVSQQLYGSDKYVGTLCLLNDIMNPFSIREGDVLVWCSESDAINMGRVPEAMKKTMLDTDAKGAIRDVRKLNESISKMQDDPNRRNYLNNRGNTFVPPTRVKERTPSVIIENNTIKISPSLYGNITENNIYSGSVGSGFGTDSVLTQTPSGNTSGSDTGSVATGDKFVRGVAALGTMTGGSGYTDGVYANTPLIGGAGSGATVTITVTGGVVTAATLQNKGKGYLSSDVLTAAIGDGSGFSVIVDSTVTYVDGNTTGASGNTTGNTTGASGNNTGTVSQGTTYSDIQNPFTPTYMGGVSTNGGAITTNDGYSYSNGFDFGDDYDTDPITNQASANDQYERVLVKRYIRKTND
jgi:hypothetical protein